MEININIKEYEDLNVPIKKERAKKYSDQEIDAKYESGELRIITEQGSFKLDLISTIFKQKKYNLRPEFQRRITWDTKKRSKLIESFVMNIPVPPVFLYEEDFSSYVVMDGLQRISAIIDYYNDVYELIGLEEWSELNGKKYSQLPKKVREGIDRRQLSVITLLKESADDSLTADKMKKMVFERLNTGGVQLEDQEIRNALYAGKFNDFCSDLSSNINFKKMWGLLNVEDIETSGKAHSLDEEENLMAAKNKLYRRMYDVELVLRYFAMRNINNYSGKLSVFLDQYLKQANQFSDEQIEELREVFETVVEKAYSMFGEKAFCIYRENKGWSQPQNMVYDAMMLAFSDSEVDSNNKSDSVENNIEALKAFYLDNADAFNGKKQSKSDIKYRASMIKQFIMGM